MNNLPQEQAKPQEMLTIKQAAEFWGCTPKQIRRLLTRYQAHINEYIQGGGRQGAKIGIKKEGLVVLRNVVNVKIAPSRVHLAKKEIAVKAIQASGDPFLQQLEMLKSVYLQMQGIEKRLELVEQNTLAVESPKTLTNPQREYLNERLRNYQYNVEVPHWRLWGKLHQEVGKASINEYGSQDYKKAMSILKQWYKEADLNWN